MLPDGERPLVAPSVLGLGVRLPPEPHADITIAADGTVGPGTGGLSVAPAWRRLPVHRIPRRLRDKFPRAAGKDEAFLWRMGDGPFTAGPFADGPLFRPDPGAPGRHGLVEPAAR